MRHSACLNPVSIMLASGREFGEFTSPRPKQRTDVWSWLFWQMGSAPYLGRRPLPPLRLMAPVKIKYCIDRFAMENQASKLDVLDRHLADKRIYGRASIQLRICDLGLYGPAGSGGFMMRLNS